MRSIAARSVWTPGTTKRGRHLLLNVRQREAGAILSRRGTANNDPEVKLCQRWNSLLACKIETGSEGAAAHDALPQNKTAASNEAAAV
jgi:hypothetical protein